MNQQVSRIDNLREALGGAHKLAANKVKNHLEPYVQAFIENAPFAIMSSADADGNCDASPKGGLPGFIKVLDERTLLVPGQGILIDIDEAYFHCPRSMQFANLWDTETIEANSKLSLKSLKKD